MPVPDADKTILRDLARRVAQIAADPVQAANTDLWIRLNRLQRTRPMIMLYDWTENGHPPTIPLSCQSEDARDVEQILRGRIHHWEHRRDDFVWEPVVYCQIALECGDYGIQRDVNRSTHAFGADAFRTVLADDADPDMIPMPTLTVDWDDTRRRQQWMADVFDGILRVELKGRWGCWTQPMDEFIQWRGIEQTLIDVIDRPEWIHAWLQRIIDHDLSRFEQCEAMGLFTLNNHADFLWTGGMLCTDELPAVDFDGEHVRMKDLWGHASTQIFSEVSPAMHEEFALQYEKQIMNRFGLCYYGCCEPLHHKVDAIFKHLDTVRKISMSPWVDVAKGAEAVGNRAVFSYKPNPAILGLPTWDIDAARDQLREVFELTRDCVIEVTMKDLHDVHGQPHRITEWVEMAKQLAEEYG
ncbi:MAG: hypothetical protein ACYS8X_01585 [Planctomycetota bacterium]|jgi:hypothetical protein